MKICKECGTSCADETVFCFVCGTKFQNSINSSDTIIEGKSPSQEPIQEEIQDERKQIFEKWFGRAIDYFDKQQHDLAKGLLR